MEFPINGAELLLVFHGGGSDRQDRMKAPLSSHCGFEDCYVCHRCPL